MKNWVPYITKMLIICMLLTGLPACGRNIPEETQESAVPEKESEPELEYVLPEITLESKEIPDNEALDFVEELKLGWNLGNTFDAVDSNLTDEMEYEKVWCGRYTTEEMIETVKNAGFCTVRIPVSWHNHLTDDKYTISEAWMDRVNEVVDWCIDRDLYVILNIHHDNSTDYLYPSEEYAEQSIAYLTAVWSQLAERYKEYDEHLIFEAMNEPRLVGHTNEWWLDTNNEDCMEAVECINRYNQAFVDLIRSSGGNNAERYLMCPGYAASPEGAWNDGYQLPLDTADNRIIVSVHAYSPYSFALDAAGTNAWSMENQSDVSNVTSFMDKLYDKFISQGIPVLIGEFGAANKYNNLEVRTEYAAYYVAAARARGLTCCWWDNNAFIGSGENLGLLNRVSSKWQYPEIVAAMLKYAE